MKEKRRLFDKRVIERNLDKGLLTQTEIMEYMANLPDMESESELLLLDTEENDNDVDVEATETEKESYNFENPENDGPRNVYDF
ncbi:MAG: hypothetical protein JXR76_03915 [Deltaproteobacteria bacterium]|nr:hypothetical protein [Deltaproteobacteria bacterium]